MAETAPPPYHHTPYPKWMFRLLPEAAWRIGEPKFESRLVKSPPELVALGVGWGESPAGPFSAPPARVEGPDEEGVVHARGRPAPSGVAASSPPKRATKKRARRR